MLTVTWPYSDIWWYVRPGKYQPFAQMDICVCCAKWMKEGRRQQCQHCHGVVHSRCAHGRVCRSCRSTD